MRLITCQFDAVGNRGHNRYRLPHRQNRVHTDQ